MKLFHSALAVLALPLLAGALFAADKPSAKETVVFGALQTTSAESARAQAEAWLKGVGKADDATLKRLDAVWASDRTLVDKVADSLALGDADAAKILADARDPAAAAPTEVPAVLRDAKKPAFFRANLALAYAKALSAKRVYEEGLEALAGSK